ncbi:MAG TPA: alpha/beta fold hydrolase [Pseudonocardiaceae bacterium]|jgi:pimeloyl-ACP methyl ester carboxylesterase|nr:alpha/beta fold hydrolase [Pseudonocardiaceae bacterium]
MTTTADTVAVNGLRLRYRADGLDNDGDPVLLLHGISRSLEDWTEQHELLADRFRVYSLDLPGHGYSDPLAEPYTLGALAGAVAGFLDTVGETRPAHVAGNSLGGAVAMRLAVDAPDRVGSLLLANSAGFGREVTVTLRLLSLRPLGELLLRWPNRNGARRVVRSLFYDPAFVTEARIDQAMVLAGLPGRSREFLHIGRALGTFRGVRPEWRAELLAALVARPIPTLVVWGERDLVLPSAQLVAARRALPHAQTHLFVDTGHMPQIERAQEFHDLAVNFWATVPAQ